MRGVKRLIAILTAIFCVYASFFSTACSWDNIDKTPYEKVDGAVEEVDVTPVAKEVYRVTFDGNNDKALEYIEVESGDSVAKPENPQKPYHSFEGWYVDYTLQTVYDFSTPITADLTLYAKYSPIRFDVELVYNNGQPNKRLSFNAGLPIALGNPPEKADCIFDGWYTSPSLSERYDFSLPLEKDITLYAKYQTDYAALTNRITTEVMKSNVRVITTSAKAFSGSKAKSGSGIIFYENSDNYYILTNNHVTQIESGYTSVSYQVEDYRGNVYTAKMHSKNGVNASSADYDLSVLYFEKKADIPLRVTEMSTSGLSAGSEVISLGQPKGQSNAITYGVVEKTNGVAPTIEDSAGGSSAVSCAVVYHTAEIDHGSSGGALLDINLKLVGVNYAGSVDKNTREFIRAYAIPVSEVKKFLDEYVWD